MVEKTVKQGDTVSGYAQKYGHTTEKIWTHAKNKKLRERREDANILYPGDKVFIPERELKEESASTQQRHRFRKLGSLEISVAVLDVHHSPLADVKYYFVVDREEQEQKSTKKKGIAKARIPYHSSEVVLHLPWGEFPLELGCLDPARTVKGIQKRLMNLGINPGPIDGVLGPKTARAIRDFQLAESDAGLSPTGQADEQTIKRLREVHDRQQLEGIHNTVESHDPDSVKDMPDDEIDSETWEEKDVDDDLGAYDDSLEHI